MVAVCRFRGCCETSGRKASAIMTGINLSASCRPPLTMFSEMTASGASIPSVTSCPAVTKERGPPWDRRSFRGSQDSLRVSRP